MRPIAPARPRTCGWRRRWPRVAEERRGMGRGLDAILPRGGKVEEGLRNIPPDLIQPNGRQPRRVFDDARLAELAESIRARGVLQPIVVRPLAGGSFELVAGERRLRAAKIAALELIGSGELSEGHGRAILVCKDHATRRHLALDARDGAWSVRETERRAREAEQGEPAPGRRPARCVASARIADRGRLAQSVRARL